MIPSMICLNIFENLKKKNEEKIEVGLIQKERALRNTEDLFEKQRTPKQ